MENDLDSNFMDSLDGKGLDDFDVMLNAPVLDISGVLLEEAVPDIPAGSWSIGTRDDDDDDLESQTSPRPGRVGKRSGITTKDAVDEADKKAKRRKQIAAASRASRARRKQELEELREENMKLREERSSFLSKIGELQVKVESMRERGSADMRVENALLRAQLEEHKRFVACFKHLCEGAPSTVSARHLVYKQGSDAAQSQVLGLISQSIADNWSEGRIGDADLPFQDLHFYYKFIAEYGISQKSRERLNVRVDITFPGFDSQTVAEFMWNSFSNLDIQQRLYRFKDIELKQLADDMPDKDTKMVYFREKWENDNDKDWVVICNRRIKELAQSTLTPPGTQDGGQESSGFLDFLSSEPPSKRVKVENVKVDAHILALSTTTTQHTEMVPNNADRITSMFVQGAATWNVGGDARLVVVFSFPDDFKLKNMEGIKDVVHTDGLMGNKFVEVLKEFNELLGELNC